MALGNSLGITFRSSNRGCGWYITLNFESVAPPTVGVSLHPLERE